MGRESLAKAAGISRVHLAYLEREKHKSPTLQTLLALSVALDVDITSLVYNFEIDFRKNRCVEKKGIVNKPRSKSNASAE